MQNPYKPPESALEENLKENSKRDIARIFLGIVLGCVVSVIFSWVIAPFLNNLSTVLLSFVIDVDYWPTRLKFDVFYSIIFKVLGGYVALKIAGVKSIYPVIGVAILGWGFYYYLSGGYPDVLLNDFPDWYNYMSFPLDAVCPFFALLFFNKK